MTAAPQRIAILGGGVGAMTAAFWLSSEENWQQKYQIDVYQMGWRLGGKGASGRNADIGQRVEEHGLHVWFGFYENAFEQMRKTYAELNRPSGSPLATCDEAFKPQSYVCLTECIENAWRVWPIETPMRPGTPGESDPPPTLQESIALLVDWIDGRMAALGNTCRTHGGETLHAQVKPPPALLAVVPAADAYDLQVVSAAAREMAHAHAATGVAGPLLGVVLYLQTLLHVVASCLGDPSTWSDELRRIYLCIDLALAVAIGMLADDVIGNGFEVINDVEFRAWLGRYGAQAGTIDSAPVRGFYDLVFAYRDGDPSQPDMEAGTMLRGMLKVALCYRGALMYKMQAGMGDVVFAPMYEVLRRRGVRFHFFHKLRQLVPDASGTVVHVIELEQQVALSGEDYAPLVEVKGLPCWPSTPLYGQLAPAQAALLQAQGVNLESQWSDWPSLYRKNFGATLPTVTLRQGEDFDRVVFGLSVSSLADVAAQLLPCSPALTRCSEQVRTVATQAYQVWLNEDLAGVGWNYPGEAGQEPVLCGFTEPFDTWAPMDQLLCREEWPPALAPKNVSYFCSTLPVDAYPPYDDHEFPQRCAARVKTCAISHLQHDIGALWIAAADGFPWRWLVDPEQREGVARFEAQYWRANVDPSERYVLSVVDSSRYRLHADESGFSNLLLAGDWLKTGLDAGCVEAAVMGGMQASRVICGWPTRIRGESGW